MAPFPSIYAQPAATSSTRTTTARRGHAHRRWGCIQRHRRACTAPSMRSQKWKHARQNARTWGGCYEALRCCAVLRARVRSIARAYLHWQFCRSIANSAGSEDEPSARRIEFTFARPNGLDASPRNFSVLLPSRSLRGTSREGSLGRTPLACASLGAEQAVASHECLSWPHRRSVALTAPISARHGNHTRFVLSRSQPMYAHTVNFFVQHGAC